ncbi:MAG: AmmeMemoRadiSam system radical SAM enzyme [Bacteroidales bacterium]|nr:AmmeMemoRadiSam system radical SAM enzyme [Bacteroidales bacterium]
MKEALYYKTSAGRVTCLLCPHTCEIKEGARGICKVRKNHAGKLYSENYGLISAINFDPVEKKPLYHFFPGSVILSIGSIGCNMKCRCCQNWQISQASPDDYYHDKRYAPEEILKLAKSKSKNIGVAYTYNEPTVFFEFMLDTAKLIWQERLKNVVVSNGFISEKPLFELLEYTDAYNIDLKAFNDKFYKTQTGSGLQPVLNTLKILGKSGKHLEITNLVIPTLNDDEREFTEMVNWISSELGSRTVLHLSRYHPMYKLGIEPTGAGVLEKFYRIAAEKLRYVYVGNIHMKDFQDTKCPTCGRLLIKRTGYFIDTEGIDKEGKCKYCGEKVIG